MFSWIYKSFLDKDLVIKRFTECGIGARETEATRFAKNMTKIITNKESQGTRKIFTRRTMKIIKVAFNRSFFIDFRFILK